MSGRSLIVNADDFGLSSGINRGIVRGFEEGILTSTTMLVNQPGFAEAAALARSHPRIRAGIHLTLLWGGPVSPPETVPSLLDGNGSLPRTLSALARRYCTGRLDLGQVKAEFRAQIRRMAEAGLSPTHADTHKHVHCLPGVLAALIEVARETGLERVRLPVERRLPREIVRPAPTSTAKRLLLRALCRGARKRISDAGLRTPDHFVGLAFQGRLNSGAFRRIFPGLHAGVTEIMCHPGYADEGLTPPGAALLHRERELEAVCDPGVRASLETHGIRLMGYDEL